MNRRNFFKVVTGFIAGIFATSIEGKKRSGTRYCGETSTGIDPNSDWAKQKPLTLDMLIKAKEELDSEYSCSASASGHPSAENSAEPKAKSKEKLVCVTPNSKRYIKWVRKEYPQFS